MPQARPPQDRCDEEAGVEDPAETARLRAELQRRLDALRAAHEAAMEADRAFSYEDLFQRSDPD